MVDAWKTDWFTGVEGQPCRIVYEQKGSVLHEVIEYEDRRRDRFQWQGSLIYGLNYTRMGNRCVQVPDAIRKAVDEFLGGLEKGSSVIRNGTALWKR